MVIVCGGGNLPEHYTIACKITDLKMAAGKTLGDW